MPTNSDIPHCALVGTRELIDDTGWDSLLDQSPFSRDKILNKRDNGRDAVERQKAERKLGLANKSNEVNLSRKEEEEDGAESAATFDSDDDLPIANLEVKVKGQTKGAVKKDAQADYYESE